MFMHVYVCGGRAIVCTIQPSTPNDDDKVAVLMQDSGLSSHQTTATTLVSEGTDTPMADLTGL